MRTKKAYLYHLGRWAFLHSNVSAFEKYTIKNAENVQKTLHIPS